MNVAKPSIRRLTLGNCAPSHASVGILFRSFTHLDSYRENVYISPLIGCGILAGCDQPMFRSSSRGCAGMWGRLPRLGPSKVQSRPEPCIPRSIPPPMSYSYQVLPIIDSQRTTPEAKTIACSPHFTKHICHLEWILAGPDLASRVIRRTSSLHLRAGSHPRTLSQRKTRVCSMKRSTLA